MNGSRQTLLPTESEYHSFASIANSLFSNILAYAEMSDEPKIIITKDQKTQLLALFTTENIEKIVAQVLLLSCARLPERICGLSAEYLNSLLWRSEKD